MSWHLQPAAPPQGKPACLLIPGWGLHSSVFTPALPALAQHFDVYTADYRNLPPTLDALVDALAACISAHIPPADTPNAMTAAPTVLGWSLGGNIALQLAQRHPALVRALCLLNTSPCFVARPDWPHGMASAVFRNFVKNLRLHPAATLQVFDQLQTQGMAKPAPVQDWLRTTRAQAPAWTQADLLQGLDYLHNTDQRSTLAHLPQPQHWFFGEHDSLAPAAARAALPPSPRCTSTVLAGAGHFVLLEHTAAVLAASVAAIVKANADTNPTQRKQQIAQAFGRAASTYNAAAKVQAWAAERLLARIVVQPTDRIFLDIGCGTGRHSSALARKVPTLGMDLAEGMARYAQQQHPQCRFITADAEQLPLPDASVDGIFSSLAVQWSAQPAALLTEWQRSLKPGGRIWLTTLVDTSLAELHQAFAQVDSAAHANHFFSAADWHGFIAQAGLAIAQHEVCTQVDYYPQLHPLLRSLKNIGAHTVLGRAPGHFFGKRQWRQLEQAYARLRQPQGLPLSYHIAFFTLVKP